MKDKDTKLLEEAYQQINERQDGEIKGVPFRYVDGVKVVSIGHLVDNFYNQGLVKDRHPVWEERKYWTKKWCEENNAYFYAKPKDDFNIYQAVAQAKAQELSTVVVEDLS